MRSSQVGQLPAPGARTVQFARLALGLVMTTLLVAMAVTGASATRGAGAAELRRGPASVLLSVLITLAGLAGVASLGLLFWSLVTRSRRTTDGSRTRRRSPVLLAGGLLAMVAVFSLLLYLALHGRRLHPLSGATAPAGFHAAKTAASLPFNQAASFATSGVVVGIVIALVLLRFVPRLGWRRALRGLRPWPVPPEDEETARARPGPAALDDELSELRVQDPAEESDPRRAVIACYLRLLQLTETRGPARHLNETPGEYLRRVLARTRAAVGPATALTALFEQARYSTRPVDEAMRSRAVSALSSLQGAITAGAVS